MNSFSEFLALSDLDQIVVLVSEKDISQPGMLNEGRWVASGKKDWLIRVDAADPAIPLQRHVHIARSKHTSAKNQQASWNEDKTRHDKGSFNASVGSLKVVQNLARDALGLPQDAILEHVTSPRAVLLESVAEPDAICVAYFRLSSAGA
ncbi:MULTISPECIES: DUF6367 family protein [Xanthomonas]|uniref:DUF6367 family protein n=1 Tax=Xanthomonas hortorum TaxID=56454 RepID=A0AA47EUX3_9XANT|nr:MULTISPECIES: DUF6367 family protein [Xanthomonas]WAH64590.1 DUF6367 family protein [Xanthomonas hortorum]